MHSGGGERERERDRESQPLDFLAAALRFGRFCGAGETENFNLTRAETAMVDDLGGKNEKNRKTNASNGDEIYGEQPAVACEHGRVCLAARDVGGMCMHAARGTCKISAGAGTSIRYPSPEMSAEIQRHSRSQHTRGLRAQGKRDIYSGIERASAHSLP